MPNINTPTAPGFFFFRHKPSGAKKWHPWQLCEVFQHPKNRLICYTLEWPSGFNLDDPTLGRMEWSDAITPPAA